MMMIMIFSVAMDIVFASDASALISARLSILEAFTVTFLALRILAVAPLFAYDPTLLELYAILKGMIAIYVHAVYTRTARWVAR